MATRIFTHGDGDGLCAGAIALCARPDAEVSFTSPANVAGDLKRARPGDEVIICDIALPDGGLDELLATMRELASSGALIYIDHHPLPPSIDESAIPGVVVHELGPCAAELAYRTFEKEVPREMLKVAVYGAVADYADDTPLVKAALNAMDKRTAYLEAGILVSGLDTLKHDRDAKLDVLRHLAAGRPPSAHRGLVGAALLQAWHEEELEERISKSVVKLSHVAYVIDPRGPLGKSAIYAMAAAGAVVGLAFNIEDDHADVSLRTRSDKVDLNVIVRPLARSLGGTGGGHPKAAGAKIPKDKVEEFAKELDKAIAEVLGKLSSG